MVTLQPFSVPSVRRRGILVARARPFEAANAYRHPAFGPATRVHGHNYVLTATIAGAIDPAIVAYIPDDRIVGLSKLARLLDLYARRPQIQERMTEQIVACLRESLNPKGARVVVQARHFCMEMRGVSKPGVLTTTSALSGAFDEERVRQEFLSLLRSRTSPD